MASGHVAQWESIGTNTVVDLFPGELKAAKGGYEWPD
jgi:hypothetical protein